MSNCKIKFECSGNGNCKHFKPDNFNHHFCKFLQFKNSVGVCENNYARVEAMHKQIKIELGQNKRDTVED